MFTELIRGCIYTIFIYLFCSGAWNIYIVGVLSAVLLWWIICFWSPAASHLTSCSWSLQLCREIEFSVPVNLPKLLLCFQKRFCSLRDSNIFIILWFASVDSCFADLYINYISVIICRGMWYIKQWLPLFIFFLNIFLWCTWSYRHQQSKKPTEPMFSSQL